MTLGGVVAAFWRKADEPALQYTHKGGAAACGVGRAGDDAAEAGGGGDANEIKKRDPCDRAGRGAKFMSMDVKQR